MDSSRAVHNGLPVTAYESGLEVVTGTEHVASTPKPGASSSGHSFGHYSVPPPPYNGVDGQSHDIKKQYVNSWGNDGEDAPIPVSPTTMQTMEMMQTMEARRKADVEAAAADANRPEDIRRQQIANLQINHEQRRIFGYRRKVFYSIFIAGVVVAIVVIAVTLGVSLKKRHDEDK